MLLFLLWVCGYITLKQLLIFYSVILACTLVSPVTATISSIYSPQSEWVSIKPAMVLLKNVAYENSRNLESLEIEELKKVIERHNHASELFLKYLSQSSSFIEQYPEISEAFRAVSIGIRRSEEIYETKQEEKRKNQEAIEEERKKRGLKSGVPPLSRSKCPDQFPIRVTNNINEPDAQGIYYISGEEEGVEVYWCFKSIHDAENDNFRPPKRKPRKKRR